MAVVYLHRRKDTYEPFYVGISTSTRRANRKDSRNKYWRHVYKKYGISSRIIAKGISWGDACELEEFLIETIGRKDLGKGPLCNLTCGGEGAPGRVLSEEHKRKISISHRGLKHTPESIEKMRNSQRGVKISEATKIKLGKKVIQRDLKGNYITEHPTVKRAAESVGVYHTSISKACRGIKKQIKGFQWGFKDE